jgi:hypothetical protein
MTNEQCFATWAPDGVAWSQWAKPVLFAQLDRINLRVQDMEPGASADVSWVPEPRDRAAIVVDLPGPASVATGIALAERGYRPVPLFNTSDGASPVVKVDSIALALRLGAETIRDARMAADAPPAFLLDAHRMSPRVLPGPGKFDNRWMVFPQDFPSGTYLRAAGIGEVLLIADGTSAREDLAHVLLRWQQAGVRILAAPATRGERPRELVIKEPSLFRRAWYRVVALSGLRRNDAGGFGAIIPIASSGSYG